MSHGSAASLSDHEVRVEGWRVLTEHLGVSGAMRFLMQYDPGDGDYTRERKELLADLTLDEALDQMRALPGLTAR